MARFQNGVIYWHPNSGAHWVNGTLLDEWAQSGYESGSYGYPSSDTAPRQGDPGSSEQQFVSGSMYSAANQYFQGLMIQAAGPLTFNSYDTGEHPDYDLSPDLSQYDTVSDPAGTATAENLQVASSTSAYFSGIGASSSEELFDYYYQNEGLPYALGTGYMNLCLRADTTNYPAPVQAPAQFNANNRANALLLAIAEANRTGRLVKMVVRTPWSGTFGAANNHCVFGLGRFSIASTTAVIAQPGPTGQHPVSLRQASHLQDIYDFANGSADYPGLAQVAINNGYDGMLLGVAKPFATYGSTSDYAWEGTA